MALILKDRVQETSTTTGTGTLTLAGAVTEFQSFSSAIGNGNTTYYTIYVAGGTDWEVGIGTVGAGTLSRDTVYASSNAGALVNFPAGTKYVFCDYPASKAVYTDASGNISNLSGGISSVNTIGFNTSYATPLTAGQMGWDGSNTFGLGMAGGNVVQHIGEDTYFYVKASATITKGQLCMFTGAVGSSGVLTAAPSNGVTNGQYIMGFAAENIANNAFGLIQCFGVLQNVDTSAYADGDILYYNSAVTGGTTTTFPASGPIVTVAAVSKGGSAGGGVISIRITFTQRLTAGTGISVSQSATGTTITNTSPSSGGTVTSVAASGGTGISVSGSPITSSGTLTITNTAPDQTVVLTAGTGISTSGTYPNFTIANTGVTAYPGAGIPNSTGSAWGTSYTTTGSGTVVALATTPSITNPTVTNYVETLYAPSAGTSFTIDLSNGTVQKISLNGNGTITLPSSVAGKSFVLIVTYSGAYTLTWAGGSTIKWPGGTAPTASSANGKFDIFTFFCDGTNTYGQSFGLNY